MSFMLCWLPSNSLISVIYQDLSLFWVHKMLELKKLTKQIVKVRSEVKIMKIKKKYIFMFLRVRENE